MISLDFEKQTWISTWAKVPTAPLIARGQIQRINQILENTLEEKSHTLRNHKPLRSLFHKNIQQLFNYF